MAVTPETGQRAGALWLDPALSFRIVMAVHAKGECLFWKENLIYVVNNLLCIYIAAFIQGRERKL